MYTRILVPLDGSTESRQALPYARHVGQGLGCPVHLLQATPTLASLMSMGAGGDYGYGAAPTISYEQWQETLAVIKRDAEEQLTGAVRELGSGQPVTTAVVEGEPASAIATEAEKAPGTLIVMATHGRSGIGRWTMGSVADKVVRAGDQPTLLVRTREHPPAALIKGIVLPLDGSDLSAAAIPHATALAKALGVGVLVLHVVQFGYPSSGFPQDFLDAQERTTRSRAEEYVRTITDRVRAEGVDADGATPTGDPASAILETAGKDHDQLVVMSTHGRSGIQRMFMGSVTDKVLRHSEGPVLAIRPTEQA